MLQIHNCRIGDAGNTDLLFETAVKNCIFRKEEKNQTNRKDCCDTWSCVNTGETMSWHRWYVLKPDPKQSTSGPSALQNCEMHCLPQGANARAHRGPKSLLKTMFKWKTSPGCTSSCWRKVRGESAIATRCASSVWDIARAGARFLSWTPSSPSSEGAAGRLCHGVLPGQRAL